MTNWIVLAGVAVGASWWSRRAPGRRGAQGDLLAVDFEHVLDLVRRVHGAQAACLITDDDVPTVATGDPKPPKDVIDRAVARAQAAMADGTDHLVLDVPEIVAVGDGRIGAALVLPAVQRSPEARQRIAGDLRRIVSAFRVGGDGGLMLRVDPQKALDGALSRLESVEGLATALCEAARSVTGLPTAIVLRDQVTHAATIVAVSRISDHRLVGNRVTSRKGRRRRPGGDRQPLADYGIESRASTESAGAQSESGGSSVSVSSRVVSVSGKPTRRRRNTVRTIRDSTFAACRW